ncbi:MAG: thioredoxin family protein [Flavobacteriaceae bacterium]|nr:MAG: thioredoxin family protein [Flavobacteriaceae bacterium]
MKNIIEKSIDNSKSYNEYRDLVSELVNQNKSTGPTQSEALSQFSALNNKRMQRLDKTLKTPEFISKKINALKNKRTFLLLAEGWCGDAAQLTPIINHVAERSDNLNLKIVLRDENEALMNEFLTNGGKSIPKLIILDENNNVINTWGPRPSAAAKLVSDYKKEHGVIDAEIKKNLQLWYNKDKGVSTMTELMELVSE